MGVVRVLFLADTHLGFDLSFRPRVQRCRRGPDFFANFKHALQPAFDGAVDCVIHGGDILYRSKVPPQLVEMAFEPLIQVADMNIPVYIVPGNHERSAIPHADRVRHPNIHIFDRPRTFILQIDGTKVALTGFAFVRQGVRRRFLDLLGQSGWREPEADIRLLCIHQSVDGATVGPADYMFRYSHDVVRPTDTPPDFAAVLSGHIHRFQVLTKDLHGNTLVAPVFYPGSIERTSFAEQDEKKGYLVLEFSPDTTRLANWTFNELPARPMRQLDVHAAKMNADQLKNWIRQTLQTLPDNAVVKLRVYGRLSAPAMDVLRAASLRSLAPATMNLTAVPVDYRKY